MHVAFKLGARHLSVTQQRGADGRLEVTVDGSPHAVEATLLDATTLRLVVEGATHTVPVTRVGDAIHLAIDGEVYVLTPQAPDSIEAGASLAAPQIVAPMPGKVLQVLVQAGQVVASGDGLLILEAMKMEHRIVAEAAATVKAVHVVDGQMVDGGLVLIELEYVAAS